MRRPALAPFSMFLATFALGGLLAASSACSSSGTGGTGGAGGHGKPGGPVAGAQDKHCGATAQMTDAASCKLVGTGGGTGTSTSTGTGTGTTGAGGAEASEYGDTQFNAEGDDDDCKYHAVFTSTDVFQNQDVTFTVVTTNKVDSKAVTGAATLIEAYLSDTHPAPNTDQKVTEGPNGTYVIGPVRFDAAGRWTVRFHFFDDCTDLVETSPHSHVAFFVDVP